LDGFVVARKDDVFLVGTHAGPGAGSEASDVGHVLADQHDQHRVAFARRLLHLTDNPRHHFVSLIGRG
jgi:hypothetical protein